jgi:hypothetical protein
MKQGNVSGQVVSVLVKAFTNKIGDRGRVSSAGVSNHHPAYRSKTQRGCLKSDWIAKSSRTRGLCPLGALFREALTRTHQARHT